MFVENLIFEHSELYEESRKVTDNLVMVKENFQAQLESELGDVKVSNLVFLNVETPIFVILPNLTVIASRVYPQFVNLPASNGRYAFEPEFDEGSLPVRDLPLVIKIPVLQFGYL